MRVLLLFPMADGQTGPAIKYAFEKLGHEVVAVDAKFNPEDSYGLAIRFKPCLVFCSRTPSLLGQVVAIKKSFKNVVTCVWNVDTRNTIGEWSPIFPLIRFCDYYFVVAKKHIPEWRKINKNTHWLTQGLQDEVYHKPDRKTNFTFSKDEHEVSFVGSITGYHAWRVDYLDAVIRAGIKLKVHGCMGLPQVYNEEHNKMVAMSKINLGMSGWPQNESYISVRDYKIMGAGGFLLERSRPGLFDIFPEGGLATYDSPQDLFTMIEVFLGEDKARKKIAEVGHKWVHREATYTHRIQKALEIMGLGGKE